MDKRNFIKWWIVLVFVLTLPACAPNGSATPELTSAATSLPVTDEPLATPSPTEPALAAPNGATIEHLRPGDTIQITSIRMVTVDIGWAIGGIEQSSDHIFYTQDGGLTWDDVTPPEPLPAGENASQALGFFKNATTAWVVYSMDEIGNIPERVNVWSTQDAGGTWQYGAVDASIGSEQFSPIFLTFADNSHGWLMVALGAGMSHVYVAVFTTNDGGITWTNILDPYTDGNIQSFSKTDMYFSDPSTGWLTRDSYGVDLSPHVFRTTDGGVTWDRYDLPAPAGMPQLYSGYACSTHTTNIFSATSAIIAMKCLDMDDYEKQLNFQYATTDGGNTWQVLPLPAGYVMGAFTDGLLFFDANYGFALGRNIYQTTNGGKNWTLIKQVAWDGQFSFVNMNNGWAVARNEDELALVRTTNGGATWEIINPYIAP